MFDLVREEILIPGSAQGRFHVPDPRATSGLLMTLYLGSASNVDEYGKAFMDPNQVAAFALRALRVQA